jgi:ribonucleotide monophosphatase NagD (HAD superfamily)
MNVAFRKYGLMTIMVLSGEAHRQDLQVSQFQPDFVDENLGALAALLKSIPRAL